MIKDKFAGYKNAEEVSSAFWCFNVNGIFFIVVCKR